MRTNKLVWLGLIGIVFLVVIVIVNIANQEQPVTTKELEKSAMNQKQKAAVLTVDGDTIDETLKQVQARYDASIQENKKLKESLNALNERIAVQEEKTGTAKGDNRIDTLMTQLNSLHGNVQSMTDQIVDQQRKYDKTAANGYTFSGGSDKRLNGKSEYPSQIPVIDGYVTVTPMASNGAYSGGALSGMSNKNLLSEINQHGNSTAKSKLSREKIIKDKSADIVTPHYTIPARSTLLDAVGMTAIIGRVPIGDTLKSPFPVKIIVGNKNLATNGLKIPGLKGIVFEGIASGNWNLACASVSLSAATFTFEDGRIQHLIAGQNRTNELGGLSPVGDAVASNPIGYISNLHGVPCIPGKRISDAHKRLATLSFFGMATSYFEAKAEAERETVLNTTSAVSGVSGDKEAFVNNRTAQDTASLVQDFYEKRNRDTFDAIVVPAGEKVVIHVTSDLLIDYHTAARKIVYSNNSGGTYANGLD